MVLMIGLEYVNDDTAEGRVDIWNGNAMLPRRATGEARCVLGPRAKRDLVRVDMQR